MSEERISHAEALYGEKKTPEPDGAPVIQGNEEKKEAKSDADVLYGKTRNQWYREPLKEGIDRLSDATGLTQEERQAEAELHAEVLNDIGVNPDQARKFHGLFVRSFLETPDEETQQKWAEQSRKAIREKYGNQADERLRRAREFVKGNDRLRKALEKSGTGNHPDVVERLAEVAWLKG